jgi:nitroreductase
MKSPKAAAKRRDGSSAALREAVLHRRSIRSFLRKPVPERTIRELIAEARWAPSWANTQPWELIVVTGERLEQFKRNNREELLAGRTAPPDIRMPLNWPETMRKRDQESAKRIFDSISVGRDDTAGRLEYYARMYQLFDAPALILFVLDKELSLEYAMLDIGAFMQTFFLLAHARGLGTCAFAGTVHVPDIVHGLFEIPDTKLLVIGAALGWPDRRAPINNFERQRASLDDFVRWIR